MKILSLAVKIIILLLLLYLTLQNTQDATFHWGRSETAQVTWPLIVLLFAAFVLGAVGGMLALLGRILQLRGENADLQREIRQLRDKRSAPAASAPPPAAPPVSAPATPAAAPSVPPATPPAAL